HSTYPDPHSFPTRRSSDLVTDPSQTSSVHFAPPQTNVTVLARCSPGRKGGPMKFVFGVVVGSLVALAGAGGASAKCTDDAAVAADGKSTRLNSSHVKISYA